MIVGINLTQVENTQNIAFNFQQLLLKLVFFFNPVLSKTFRLLTL